MKEKIIEQLRESSRKRHLIIGVVLLFFIAVFIIFSSHGLITRISLELEKGVLEEHISVEKKAADSLKKVIHRLETDTTEIERIAREEYGMLKEGEKIYFIRKKQERKK